MTSVISLTTDFGLEDPYAGIMKTVILGINPKARLVDFTHSVGPQNVRQGSFLLGSAFRYSAQGTIHLVVVDPGVGSTRRALAVAAGGYYFVAPDNGILTHALAEIGLRSAAPGDTPVLTELAPGMRAVELTRPEYWLHPVSSTFHGRDVFAPVAAHISLGTDIRELGQEVSSVLLFPMAIPIRQHGGAIIGHVIHIDHFGNLVTDIRVEDLPDGPVDIVMGNSVIHGVSPSYADAIVSEDIPLLAVPGSTGYLDIAARNGNAAELLKVGLGYPVEVVPIGKG